MIGEGQQGQGTTVSPCPPPTFSYSEFDIKPPEKILYLAGQRTIDIKLSLHVLNPLEWHLNDLNRIRAAVYRAGQRSPANMKINAYAFNMARIRQIKNELPEITRINNRIASTEKARAQDKINRKRLKYLKRNMRYTAINLNEISEILTLMPKRERERLEEGARNALKAALEIASDKERMQGIKDIPQVPE